MAKNYLRGANRSGPNRLDYSTMSGGEAAFIEAEVEFNRRMARRLIGLKIAAGKGHVRAKKALLRTLQSNHNRGKNIGQINTARANERHLNDVPKGHKRFVRNGVTVDIPIPGQVFQRVLKKIAQGNDDAALAFASALTHEHIKFIRGH